MPFVSCTKSAADDAATLEAAKDYADSLVSGGVTPSGAAGGDLSGTYPNPTLKPSAVVDAVQAGIADDAGAQTAIASAIVDEIVGSSQFAAAVANAAPNLKTCSGGAMAAGANVPTCTEMNTAISAAVGSGVAPSGTAGGALTGTYPNPGLSAAAVVSAMALKNCAGGFHPAGVALPSCAEMTAAIEDAIDALPGDKFLQGLQSYNAATNTMVLAMSDGTTVSIDMTALLNDAVASVTATPDASETVKGIVELATVTEVAAGTNTTLAVTPAGVAAAIAANATPDATDTVKGKVSLAVAANMPSTSDTEAATPAAVNAAIAANNTAMGASAAETIAGAEANKFISPDDLKAALQVGANYPISNKNDAGDAIFSESSAPVYAQAAAFLRSGGGAGNAVYGIRGGTGSGHALEGDNQTTVDGSAVVGTKSGGYKGALGFQFGALQTGVYGLSNGVAGAWAGYFEGNVFYSGSLTPSDKRLKSDFKTAPVLGALKIQSFDKHYYTRDDAGNEQQHSVGRQVGIIAQDLQAVAPELVEEAGGYLAVKETSVLFALIAELQSKVAALEGAVL